MWRRSGRAGRAADPARGTAADQAAVAREERRAVDQRVLEPAHQVGQFGNGAGARCQRRSGAAQLLLDARRARQTVADRVQIARPAAAERQARERAPGPGTPSARRADRRAAPARPAGPPRHRGACGSARPRQRRREAGRKQAAAGAGHGAVHRGEQAARALAGEAREQLEIASRRGIDQQVRARDHAPRRQQAGQTLFLGQFDIADQRAARGSSDREKAPKPSSAATPKLAFSRRSPASESNW